MSTATATTLMMAEEFVRDYGDSHGVELVRGQLVRLPIPGTRHGEIGMNAGYLVTNHVKQAKCGRVFGLDTFIRVRIDPDGYRGADVGYISFEKLPKVLPTPAGPLEIAPELVIEVKSPTDRWKAIREKIEEYLSAGVRVVVVIDPASETLTAYRDDELHVTFHNGDTVTISDVLPGFAVPVKACFE